MGSQGVETEMSCWPWLEGQIHHWVICIPCCSEIVNDTVELKHILPLCYGYWICDCE